MIEIFSMTGGLRTEDFGAAFPFNMSNASWPFARITATRERLILRVFSKTYEIERGKVDKLAKHKGVFSVGLRITHSKNEIPPGFIFWTFNFTKLKLSLEILGYKVEA